MRSYWQSLIGVTLLTCYGLTGCAAKDGVVGEVDDLGVGGEGADGPGSRNGSTRFFVSVVADFDPEEDRCWPRPLPVAAGEVACQMYGAEPRSGECCRAPLRSPAGASASAAVLDELRRNGSCDGQGQPSCTSLCVCEIAKAAGDDLDACLDAYAGAGDGWCYIAPDQGFGAADTVANCQGDARQRINLAGQASLNGAELGVLACAGGSAATAPTALGSVCLPSLEQEPDFHGFSLAEVNVIEQSTCESGLCLVAHFQGRVSCPYGQTQEDPSRCFLPGSDANVTVGVPPQLVARPPSLASICSCRCAGPGPGPFCGCSAEQECAELIADLGLPESQPWAGSYCVPRGALDDWSDAGGRVPCDPDTASCGEARPY